MHFELLTLSFLGRSRFCPKPYEQVYQNIAYIYLYFFVLPFILLTLSHSSPYKQIQIESIA